MISNWSRCLQSGLLSLPSKKGCTYDVVRVYTEAINFCGLLMVHGHALCGLNIGHHRVLLSESLVDQDRLLAVTGAKG